MSRGFVKEEDQEEAPFIAPRAALPSGATNYVTPEGFDHLKKEREEMEKELANLDYGNEKEKRHARAILTGKLNLLNERISSARILKPGEQPKDEVRFGASVKFRFLEENKNNTWEFKIVGVDEADIKLKKIAFVAPLATAITGKKVGEKAKAFMGGKFQELEILSINYSG